MASTVLDPAGDELLSAMRADVPRRRGRLAAGLSKKLLRRSLKLRVGLIGKPINRRLFYGWIVELGRKAQTVIASRKGAHRAVGGRIAGRRMRALAAGTSGVYRMRVRAMPARHFVYSRRTELRGSINKRLNAFWNKTLAKAAAGASDE